MCPVTPLQRLIRRAGLSGDRPLFSRVTASAYADAAPLAYDHLRTAFLAKFAAIGLDTAQFGTQSCRAGGATLAANIGIPDRLWREHGCWRSHRGLLQD